jgi:hypothetical protein
MNMAKKTNKTPPTSSAPVIDPFAVPTAAPKKKGSLDEIAVPKDMASDIDEYVKLKRQMNELESRCKLLSGTLVDAGLGTWANRAMKGRMENFKFTGTGDNNVTFLLIDKGSTIAPGEKEALANTFGKDVVDQLVAIDYSSLRLNPEVMENPTMRAKVEDAMRKLATDLGVSPLMPPHFCAVKGAASIATRLVKDVQALANLISCLKLTKYVKIPSSGKSED